MGGREKVLSVHTFTEECTNFFKNEVNGNYLKASNYTLTVILKVFLHPTGCTVKRYPPPHLPSHTQTHSPPHPPHEVGINEEQGSE